MALAGETARTVTALPRRLIKFILGGEKRTPFHLLHISVNAQWKGRNEGEHWLRELSLSIWEWWRYGLRRSLLSFALAF